MIRVRGTVVQHERARAMPGGFVPAEREFGALATALSRAVVTDEFTTPGIQGARVVSAGCAARAVTAGCDHHNDLVAEIEFDSRTAEGARLLARLESGETRGLSFGCTYRVPAGGAPYMEPYMEPTMLALCGENSLADPVMHPLVVTRVGAAQ